MTSSGTDTIKAAVAAGVEVETSAAPARLETEGKRDEAEG